MGRAELRVAPAPTSRSTKATLTKSVTAPTIVVPPPTGNPTTDMPAILSALKKAVAGSAVIFQAGSTPYAVDQELPIPRGIRITGCGSTYESSSVYTMPTLQQVPGADLICIAASFNYLDGLYGPTNPGKYPTYNKLYGDGATNRSVTSAIEVDHLAFDGQNGGTGSGNVSGHGMVMFTYGANIHDCYFLNVAQTGIYIADCNYLGEGATNENHENRIQDNVVVNPGWWGIRVDNDFGGSGGATDGHILRNVVRSPSKQRSASGPNVNSTNGRPYEAVFMANAAGWWIIDNHLIACPGNALYTNTTGGLHLDFNTVDGFGCYPQPHKTYVGLNITTAGQTKLHPGRIVGNLVAAYEGSNPFAPSTVATPTVSYEYFKIAMQTTPGRLVQATYNAYPTHADNVAHQASGPPGSIADATIPNRAYVAVPTGRAAQVVPGVGISDSAGLIKKGTTVSKVTPGSGTNPDLIYLSAEATHTTAKGVTDTVSFAGPQSTAWTYVNALPAANMWVRRTNEAATGSIDPVPAIQITVTKGTTPPTITVIDPSDYVGNEYVVQTPAPEAGQVIVAGSTSAAWQTVTTSTVDVSAAGALSGTFPNPAFSTKRLTRMFTSGSYQVPWWTHRVRVTCLGAGGGGGGGTSGKAGQVGGAGGAAGATATQVVETAHGKTLTVVVGTGGRGGAGTASGSGAAGDAGGATSVGIGTEILVVAGGGPGGAGAAPGKTAAAGGAYGGAPGVTTPVGAAGCGGSSGSTGGSPFDFSPGGGGGGGSATSSLGGAGGAAGTQTVGGAAGAAGGNGAGTGGKGGSATSPGAPGGGGGAGFGATGGNGGSGADGLVIVEVVG